ncbi:hypothetical protein [Clostridium sardiniense]|uniref:hypothetical protein n=1 Tax=Clostridium sardiniense TaxID=29369 RepID=UPI00195D6AA1|nr:hypothetical protein [Clostridium sardiniense]MBM7836311.1 very-short-patch-repair endonuclease [Clostridium sardiniense]
MQNNQVQVGVSDEFNYDNLPIKYDITTDGHLGLYVEDCAKALGVTTKKVLKDNNESITVRYDRVYEDLVNIGILRFQGSYNKISNEQKKIIRNTLKTLKISVEEFILWCNRVNTLNSDMLIQILNNYKSSKIIIPKPRKEIQFLDKLEEVLKPFNVKGIRQYKILNYRIDYYIPGLRVAIEYDENNHNRYTYEAHELRQKLIEHELSCRFIRVSDDRTDEYNIGIIIKEIFEI